MVIITYKNTFVKHNLNFFLSFKNKVGKKSKIVYNYSKDKRREFSMKFSKQRELILNYILNSHEHLTADTIYSDLKKTNPELSLGTVYRNLTKLTEIGAIKKVSLPNQVDKFDKNLEPHAHFICDECGDISDINIPGIDMFLDKVSTEKDISINKYNITFNGTCEKCKTKNKH